MMPETNLANFLAPFPWLQIAGAIATLLVVLTISGIGIMRASHKEQGFGSYAQYYLTGPIEKTISILERVLGTLEGIYRESKETRGEQRETFREFKERTDIQTEVMRSYLRNQDQMLKNVEGVFRTMQEQATATRDLIKILERQIPQRRS